MKKVFLNNFLFYFLLIILLIFFGYLRDFLFVNINSQLDKLNNKASFSELSPKLSFITNFSYRQLYIGKWGLTLLFIFIYFILSQVLIKKMFKEKKFLTWTSYSFLIIIVISSLFYVYGVVFNDYERGYALSRVFMGMMQSPFVLMVLIPAFKLSKSHTKI